ncbi:SurA N-terminal domain-containing protein [Candidatus Daviesbacteria bacterium]|nr:SurA N-terminal domain-containing protein [Candidatus Daviesbacteria bacterium]
MPDLPKETPSLQIIKSPASPKRLIFGLLLAFTFLLGLFLANFFGVLKLSSYIPALSFLPTQKDFQTVTKVGDKKITGRDFDQQFKATLGLYAQKEASNDKLKEKIFNSLVEKEIVKLEAAKLGISVSPEEIEKIYQERVKQTGGQEKYNDILKTNGWTIDEQKEKIQDELLKEKVEDQVVAWRLVEGASLFKDTSSSDFAVQKKKAQDSLEKVRAGMLAGKTPKDAIEEAKKGGSDKLIRYNEPVRVIKSDNWDPEFIQAFFGLTKGSISTVISSAGGSFMVVKIVDANDAPYASYQDWLDSVKKDYLK